MPETPVKQKTCVTENNFRDAPLSIDEALGYGVVRRAAVVRLMATLLRTGGLDWADVGAVTWRSRDMVGAWSRGDEMPDDATLVRLEWLQAAVMRLAQTRAPVDVRAWLLEPLARYGNLTPVQLIGLGQTASVLAAIDGETDDCELGDDYE